MRAFIYLPALFFLFAFSVPVAAQRWLWGRHISYAPFVVNAHGGYLATDKAGNVYTASCLGAFAGTNLQLGGVTSHFGALSITDSIIDSVNFGQTIITKYDANGIAQWVVGTQRCDAGIASIATDGSGNVYALGVYDHSGTIGNYPLVIPPGNYHNDDAMYFLAKISSAGTVLWARNIFATTSEEGSLDEIIDSSDGGSFSYSLFEDFSPYGGVAADSAGNCYVTGLFIDATVAIDAFTLSKTDTTGHSIDMFVAKFDPSGVAAWAENFGSHGIFQPKPPVVSQRGDVYVIGTYMGDSVITLGPSTLTASLGNPYIPGDFIGGFLMKIDNNGIPRWAVAPDSMAWINGEAVDTAGNVYITGLYNKDSISFGGHELINSAHSFRHSDVFLVMYDATGNPLWAASGGGPSSAAGLAVTTDQCGHVFVAGNIQSSGPDSSHALYFKGNELLAPSPATNPTFIATFDDAGNFLDGQGLPDGAPGGITPTVICADNSGSVFLGGQWAEGTFSFGADNFTTDSGESFTFVARLQHDSLGCLPYKGEGLPPATTPTTGINIYPNPAHTQLVIQSSSSINEVTITNLLGQTTCRQLPAANCQLLQLDVASMPAGMYLVRVNGTFARRFVKE